jgi:CRISPR-associated protein Cst1
MNDKNSIKLYPTNWLYNSALIGFLSVLYGNGYDVDAFLSEDGTITFPDKKIIAESINQYKKFNEANKQKPIPLIGKNANYPNYLQKGEEEPFEDLISDFVRIEENDSMQCSLCTQHFYLQDNPCWTDAIRKVKARIIDSGFTVIHSSLLAPSIKKFPNALWNMKATVRLCPLCAYLLVFSHIAFTPTTEGSILINGTSFKIMWHLNKYASKALSRHNARNVFALSFMEYSQKINATLGMWSIANNEIIIKARDGSIDHYSMPYDQTRVLLNRRISALITRTREPNVLDAVLSGRLVDLLTMNEKLLKAVQSNNIEDGKRYLRNFENHNQSRMRTIVATLPELYIQVNKQLHEEVI